MKPASSSELESSDIEIAPSLLVSRIRANTSCEVGFVRIICATHSQTLIESPETYVINLDNYINRNVLRTDLGVEGSSTIQ